jgi:hypothetical protein
VSLDGIVDVALRRIIRDVTSALFGSVYESVTWVLRAEAWEEEAVESMTRLPVPVYDIATKRPLPYVTEVQLLSAALVRVVHVMPSGEVMIRLPVPELATATKSPLP